MLTLTRLQRLALAFLILWGLLVLLMPLLPLRPDHIVLEAILQGPNSRFWLGTDELGRDILSRLLSGAGVSLLVAVTVVLCSGLIGIFVGLIAGYVGGWLDLVLLRVIDVFLAFPGLLLAIALAGLLEPGVGNVVIALCTVGWVGFARLARAQVLSLRESDHIQAAICQGLGNSTIFLRHLLPLMSGPLVVEATFGIAGAVLAEAGLSFLGLGIQAPEASWGSMIRDGSRYLLVAPHFVLAPGIALMLVVISVNVLGDVMRDRLDVRQNNGGSFAS